jgi:hypothetical protein
MEILAKMLRFPKPDETTKQDVYVVPGGNRRASHGRFYSIPKQYLPTPGQPVVDFGHRLFRLDAAG